MTIFEAIEAGDAKKVAAIIAKDKKALRSKPPMSVYEPIHFAAEHGNVGVLEALIAAGAKPDAPAREQSPLGIAVAAGHTDAVRALLKHGAKLTPPKKGPPALAVAISNGRFDVARALLQLGADPNATFSEYGEKQSILHRAIKYSFRIGGSDFLEDLLEADADPNIRGKDDERPLHAAALAGNVRQMQLLLDAGADPEAADNSGASAIFWAVMGGRLAALRLLLKLKVKLTRKSTEGKTPLQYALELGHRFVAEELMKALKKTGTPKLAGDPRPTELAKACQYGDVADIKRILKVSPALIHSRLRQGVISTQTPLHLAANYGQVDAVKALLDGGAEVDAQNQFQVTALDEAASAGSVEVAKVLLAAGANLEHKDHIGTTPLWSAIEKHEVEMVKFLIGAGADFKKPQRGVGYLKLQTPLDHARTTTVIRGWEHQEPARLEIIQVLKKAGAKK